LTFPQHTEYSSGKRDYKKKKENLHNCLVFGLITLLHRTLNLL
jgi:hypothetical protein